MPTLFKLLILMVFLVPYGADSALAAAAKIEMVGKGESVKVKRSGAIVRAKKGDLLQSGDEVTTDAQTAVDLRLEDDTLIRVGVSSTYTLQEDSKLKTLVHRLLSGIVRVLVPVSDKKENNIKFRMYTSEGTIGVRGTEFVVIRKDGETQLRGLEGVVMFGPPEMDYEKKDEFVMVTGGFKSAVKAGAKNLKPEKFDLQQYHDELSDSKGPFGPLADHSGTVRKHARGDSLAAPAPVALSTGGNAKGDERVKVIPSPRREKKEKIDWQQKLFEAAAVGNIEEAEDALKHHAHTNGRGDQGYTALHYALDSEKQDMFMYLISHGANVDIMDKDGLTPLMFVAKNKLDMKFALALVHPGGADLDLENKKGETATSIAKASGYQELVDYLDSKEAGDDALEAKKHRQARQKEAEKKAKKKDKE